MYHSLTAVKQIITILFSYYIGQEHFRVGQFLPIRDCLEQDAERDASELEFLRDCYRQPELAAPRTLWPESLSPMDVPWSKDVEDSEKAESRASPNDADEQLEYENSFLLCLDWIG